MSWRTVLPTRQWSREGIRSPSARRPDPETTLCFTYALNNVVIEQFLSAPMSVWADPLTIKNSPHETHVLLNDPNQPEDQVQHFAPTARSAACSVATLRHSGFDSHHGVNERCSHCVGCGSSGVCP